MRLIDDGMNIKIEIHEEKEVVNDDSNFFGGALTSWWPTTISDVQDDVPSESWWPTNPIIIDSLEAKSPSESTIIDWSFLDSEYHDPPPQIDNKEVQVGKISSGIGSQILDGSIGLLPRYSTSNTNDMQINMLRSTRTSNIEGQKVQSWRGSLSMLETIKDMTT